MRYNPIKIEKKWRQWWIKSRVYEPDLKRATRPFYNLMMFPYPSAEGLHIGSVRTFSGIDIYGRFKRMQGFDVFEPIGLDGFGIHSENYALKIGKHPMQHAKDSEKNFYRQLGTIGNSFAWQEKLETHDPEYYRWTQWIFTEMFKYGLAYRKKAPVNWCPSCMTVLADEQVLSGECERCGSQVIKKDLEQWFFRITKYAERLLKNLETIDWPEPIKIAQRNWIGKSEGLVFRSPVKDTDIVIETFSAHFEAFTADTFMVIAPDHPLLPKLLEGTRTKDEVLSFCRKIISDRKEFGYKERELEGIFTGRYTVDPVGNGELPVWVASYALSEYGTGIVKCSAHDERDFAFAKKYKIRLKPTLLPQDEELREAVLSLSVCYSDMQNGILTEPVLFAGKVAGNVRNDIVSYCIVKGLAYPRTMFRLRDWLVSRQRYWGPPIPMVFCKKCRESRTGERKDMPGWFSVSEKDLPVKLPFVRDFRPKGTGESPLATVSSFYKVRCPKCKSWARRETDVSDTFLDSAWYYLRYPSVRESKHPWNSVITKKWLPVDMYIGGAEHAVLHLLYVRFLAMCFYDWKLVHFEEPFKKFRTHGLITKGGAKMSKSKGNIVNPDEYINAYGSDAVRMYLAFLAPLDQGGDFRDEGIKGVTRFLERVWKLFTDGKWQTADDKSKLLRRLVHQTIKKVTEDLESLRYNTVISALMILLNKFEEKQGEITKENAAVFLKLLAPFAPHIAEELWFQLQGESKRYTSIHVAAWPKCNPRLIKEETFELVVQVNGRVRGRITLPVGVGEKEAAKAALSNEAVKKYMVKNPSKIVFVANKLINFVV